MMSGGGNFVPMLLDTSDFNIDAFRSSYTSAQQQQQQQQQHPSSAELNKVLDISLDSLRGPPVSSRTVASAVTSNHEGLLNGLRAMKARINMLEQRQGDSKRSIFGLQQATDTYTRLLMERPRTNIDLANSANERIGSVENAVDLNSNLLSDEEIQTVYNRLRLRLNRLEGKSGIENSHSEPNFRSYSAASALDGLRSSSSLSDVEKTRGAPISDKKLLQDMSTHFNTTTIPSAPAGFSLKSPTREENAKEMFSFKPISFDQESNGSSRSLKLNDKQRQRLSLYAEKLRTSEIIPAAASSPINKSTQCEICRLTKSVQCQCDEKNVRTENWAQTSFLPPPPSFQPAAPVRREEHDGRVEYDELRRQILLLKHQINQRNVVTYQDDAKINSKVPRSLNVDLAKRPSSAPTSPIRKVQKFDVVVDKKPAFVPCKSVESSHSIMVNLQELFAILKRQNPALHQVCLKLGANATLMNMATAFEKEIESLKRKAKNELIEKLKMFDEFSQELQSCNDLGRKSELEQRQNTMVAEIEKLDTYVQRLNAQSATLALLTRKAKAQMSSNSKRKCYTSSLASKLTNNDENSLTKHTVSSKQRTSSLVRKDSSKNVPIQHAKAADMLKEIKLAKDVLSSI